MHHLGSWIKTDQLDVTCFIISLFTAQHVSNVLTFEMCWAVNSEIIKQVTSSWSVFIQKIPRLSLLHKSLEVFMDIHIVEKCLLASFCLRLSFFMYQFGSLWMNFHQIHYWRLIKFCQENSNLVEIRQKYWKLQDLSMFYYCWWNKYDISITLLGWLRQYKLY